jgi:hypothetical protein
MRERGNAEEVRLVEHCWHVLPDLHLGDPVTIGFRCCLCGREGKGEIRLSQTSRPCLGPYATGWELRVLFPK